MSHSEHSPPAPPESVPSAALQDASDAAATIAPQPAAPLDAAPQAVTADAITAADLAALDRAIADGILTVSQRGRSVTFQNTTQLLAARTHVARLLARNQPGRAPTSGFARGISFGVADFR